MQERESLSFQDFERWLSSGHLNTDIGGLAAVLARIEDDQREEAIRLALEWIKRIWSSEAVWNGLRAMPPLMMPNQDADARDFLELLFPNVIRAGNVAREKPESFWTWQKSYSQALLDKVVPARDVARSLWVRKCEESVQLSEEVTDLARAYAMFVRLTGNTPLLPNWHVYVNNRRVEARRGRPDCGHVEVIGPCKDTCTGSSFKAHEAHFGWQLRSDWYPRRDVFGKVISYTTSNCRCCKEGHNYVPVGDPRCGLCAEAVYEAGVDVLVSKYGGWYWLREAIRIGIEELAHAQDNELADLERSTGIVGRDWSESEVKEWQRRQALGGNPWRRDHLTDPIGAIAVFFIPVPMFASDIKRDVGDRLTARFDEFWNRLNLSKPKNTGRSKARAEEWGRNIDWLWSLRVEDKSLTRSVRIIASAL